MIDIETDSLLTLSEAAKSLPGRPALSTLHRWRLRGVRGVRLETCLIGGRRYTTARSLAAFASAVTAAANGEPKPNRTPQQRERAVCRADAELDELMASS